VAHDAGIPVPETTSAVGVTPAGSTMTTTNLATGTSSFVPQMGVAATSSDDDDVFEVIMGCPCLQVPELISLLEVLGTTHSALHHVRHVLQRDWDELRVEQQHLKDFGSMLKAWTKSVQQKAVDKRAYLDTLEAVLKEE
jgi:hypothetical protein